MLTATLLWLAHVALTGASPVNEPTLFAEGAAIVLSGAAVGKVLGLFYWNLVFRRTAQRLRALLARRQAVGLPWTD